MLFDLKLLKPKTPDRVLDGPISALSLELTRELSKSKLWFLQHIKLFEKELKKNGIKLPKKQPKSISEFYNSLPLSVRKSLQKSAQNERVLLYLLQSPRTVFDQVIQDLQKTLSKAYKNIAEGKAVRSAGFPKFKKLVRHGGVRLQADSRTKEFSKKWKNQQIFLSELGVINWQDSGYVLPETPCKMLTLKKDKTGKYFLTFFGEITYGEKRLKQKERSLARKPVIPPAKTLFDFFESQTAAFDIGRKSGLIQVVSDKEQDVVPPSNTLTLENDSQDQDNNNNKNHPVRVLSSVDLARMVKKENGKLRYIKYQQKKLSRQDKTKKKNKKRKIKNKNGLHVKGKHSRRRLKTQDKINKAYEGLANLREFFLRALAQKMISGKTVIFLEDLDVKSMLKNKKKSKSKKKDKDTKDQTHQDQETTKTKKKSGKHTKNDKNSQHRAGFGRFNAILEEECLKNNVLILRCDRYDPTSQLCSSCGFHWGKLDTSVREITCPSCSKTHNRDQNAGVNIKFLALYRYLLREKLKDNNKSTTRKVVNKSATKVVGERLSSSMLVSAFKPLAERVNGGKTGDYSSFAQISHDEILMYINQFYPIDNVLVAIEQHSKKVVSKKEKETPGPETKPCGKPYHPVFSKPKGTDQAKRRAS